MGFTTGSYQQTVYTITGDGLGGFWWASKDSSDRVYRIGYEGGAGTIRAGAVLYGRDTFKQLITAFIQNNLLLPDADVKINVEGLQEANMLSAQFEAPELSDADLGIIANNYDIVEFLQKFAVFPLVRRYYLLGGITLVQLADILIYMGQGAKISREKAKSVTDALVNMGDITQAQADNFLQRWDNEVTI